MKQQYLVLLQLLPKCGSQLNGNEIVVAYVVHHQQAPEEQSCTGNVYVISIINNLYTLNSC